MSSTRNLRIEIKDLPTLEGLTQEEMARIFGAGRQPRVRLGVEALESRELMASHLTATLTEGVLRIEGTGGADRIRILESDNRISVDGVSIQASGGHHDSLAASAIARISVDGMGGDDHIWIGNGVQPLKPILEVLASSGRDSLHSGGQVVGTGLADGVLKTIQAGGNIYGLSQDGGLSVNGQRTWGETLDITVNENGELLRRNTSDVLQRLQPDGQTWAAFANDEGTSNTGFGLTSNPVTQTYDRLVNGNIVAYDHRNEGMLTLNVMQHTYYADIDLGFGVKLDTTKFQEYVAGKKTLPQIDPLKALSFAINREKTSNQYDQVRTEFYNRFAGGVNEVFLTSERFTNWASPQKILELGAKAYFGAAEAAGNEILSVLKQEFWDLVSWAQRKWGHGSAGLDGLLLGLEGLGQHLRHSAYWIPVNYREGGLTVSHRAFALRTTDSESGTLDVREQYFSNPFDSSAISDVIGGTGSGVAIKRLLDNVKSLFVDVVSEELPITEALKQNFKEALIDTAIYNTILAGTGINFAAVRDAQQRQGGTAFVDLRGTDIEDNVKRFLNRLSPTNKLAQGNEGELSIKTLEFNTSNYTLKVEFEVRHRHVWPSASEMAQDLYHRAKQGVTDVAKAVWEVTKDLGEVAKALANGVGDKLRDAAEGVTGVEADVASWFGKVADAANIRDVDLADVSRWQSDALEQWDKYLGSATSVRDGVVNPWMKWQGEQLSRLNSWLTGQIGNASRNVDAWMSFQNTELGRLNGQLTEWVNWRNGVVNPWTQWQSDQLASLNSWLKGQIGNASRNVDDWANWRNNELDRLGDSLTSWTNWRDGVVNPWTQWQNTELSRLNSWLTDQIGNASRNVNDWVNWRSRELDRLGDQLTSWVNWRDGVVNPWTQWRNNELTQLNNWLNGQIGNSSRNISDWVNWRDQGVRAGTDRLDYLKSWASGELARVGLSLSDIGFGLVGGFRTKSFNEYANDARNAGRDVGNAIGSGIQSVGQAVQGAVNQSTGWIRQFADTVKTTLTREMNAAKARIDDYLNRASRAISAIGSYNDVVADVRGRANTAINNAWSKFNDAKRSIDASITDVRNRASRAIGAINSYNDVVADVRSRANTAINNARSKFNDAKRAIDASIADVRTRASNAIGAINSFNAAVADVRGRASAAIDNAWSKFNDAKQAIEAGIADVRNRVSKAVNAIHSFNAAVADVRSRTATAIDNAEARFNEAKSAFDRGVADVKARANKAIGDVRAKWEGLRTQAEMAVASLGQELKRKVQQADNPMLAAVEQIGLFVVNLRAMRGTDGADTLNPLPASTIDQLSKWGRDRLTISGNASQPWDESWMNEVFQLWFAGK